MNKNLFAKTPPMGWNSWDCYGAAVNEEELRANADYMAAHLKSHGWEYVVCDIQWYEPEARHSCYRPFVPLEMDEYSRLIPAANRFPSAANGKGFGPIAEYVHSLGLKFGIHIMRGIPRQAVHAGTPIHTGRSNTTIPSLNCMPNGASILSRWTTSVSPLSARTICIRQKKKLNLFTTPSKIAGATSS